MSQSNALRREVDAAPVPQEQSFELRPLPGPVGAEIIGQIGRASCRERVL